MPLKAAELAEAIGNLVAEAEGIEVDLTDSIDTARGRRASDRHDRPAPARDAQRHRARADAGRGRPGRDRQGLHQRPGGPLVPRAAATTPCSRPCRASCPTSACAARTSCSSPASAARRASPTTSRPTACTRSTAAPRRSRPASPPPARTSRSGSSPATATRSRSAATT